MANIIERILRFGAFIIVIPLMLIPIIYHIADQQNEQITKHTLYSTFDSDIFNQFEKKLDKLDRINIFGSKQDQIEHFANHYASIKKEKGWKVINWDLNDGTYFQNSLLLGQIRKELETYFDLQQEKKILWILDCNIQDKSIRKQAISFIQKIVLSHPSSKFLVISNSFLKIKGFKLYQVPQISHQHFIGLVSTKLGLNQNQGKIIVNHFGSVLQTLQATKEKEFTLENILGVYHRNFTNQSPKQLEILSKLCEKGKVKSSEQLSGVQKMGAYWYQGVYFWRSPQSILNYKLQTQKKKCVFYDPGLPQYLIPSDPYETIFDDQQDLQQQLEQKQDFYQSIDDDYYEKDQPNNNENNEEKKQSVQEGGDTEQRQKEDQNINSDEEIQDTQNVNQKLIEANIENAQNQNQNQDQDQNPNQNQIQDNNKQQQNVNDETNLQQNENIVTEIPKDSVKTQQTKIQENKQKQQNQIHNDENDQINAKNQDKMEVVQENDHQIVEQHTSSQNPEQIPQQQPNVEVKSQQKKEQSGTKTQNKV